ncbi:hypothetical protein [Halorussus sp. AFM4]|uniref:hypothetical protein n=1 Tax=Halorussus sp. AFM4 TaxID=3421651 RepID=UPI003EBFEA06
MVPRAGPLCLALALVLAGCAGVAPGGEQTTTDPTETATPTATTATVDASTVADGPATTAMPPTLESAALSAVDRELLGRAVGNDSVRVTRTNATGRVTPETDGWRVRYRGTLYRLSWQYGGLYGEYRLHDATEVNASTVDPSTGVVAYANLTPDARRLFDAALAGNESELSAPGAFPDQLRDNGYVTRGGDYYALEVAVADHVVYRLSLVEVES